MPYLPTSAELGFLVSREICLISFAPYQVNLHFTGQISMTVQSPFRYTFGNCVEVGLEDGTTVGRSSLMRLLEKAVIAVDVRADGALEFAFVNEDTLLISKNVGHYDSYHISCPGKDLQV